MVPDGEPQESSPPQSLTPRRLTLRAVVWLLTLLTTPLVLVFLGQPAHGFEAITRYASLHAALETFAVCVSAMVFAIGWNAGTRERGRTHALLACAFLAVAALDFLHGLSFKGMPVLVTPSDPEKAIHFWFAARFAAGLGLLVAVATPSRRSISRRQAHGWLGAALAYVAFAAWLGLFHADWLPRTMIPGRGLTGIKVATEWALILLSAASAALAHRRVRQDERDESAVGLFAAAGVTILSELCFTAYSEVTDAFNLLGHLYKIVAYALIYRAVVVAGVRAPFDRLRESEERVRALNAELERRVAEAVADLRVANDALTRAATAKDEFLASMSHELRTPLNAVLGVSEALTEGVYGPLAEQQKGALRRVEDSGRHLLALISDILDLAKIEAGRMQLDAAPVAVGEVCRASLELVEDAASRKRQTLSISLEDGWTEVVADERRLKQVLVNLLGNAVKFTPPGGRIGIEAGAPASADRVRITVWDTGIGISAEDQARLFQPFVQLDAGLSREHAGTGLGLSLVRKLVELSGGVVSLESTPGEGSRFTVELPRRRPTAGEAPAAAEDAAPSLASLRADGHPCGRLLLADDDDLNLSTEAEYLRARGHDVIVARDGREAVRLARETRPDLILMDVQMPHLDGLEATREIRLQAAPGSRPVPILAVTALAMPGDRERCLAAGADGYLTKPISLRKLATVVEATLRTGQPPAASSS